MLNVDFKNIVDQLKNGRYLIDTIGYKGKPYYGVYDNYNKNLVYPIMGLKDSMVLCEMLCYLSLQELSSEVKDNLRKVYSNIINYIEVGEICNSLEKVDLEEYPNSLLAFDNSNNTLKYYIFYIRTGKKVKEIQLSDVRNIKINYIKCWTFINSLKGQTRMSPVYSFDDLSNWFEDTEILYICYILQYSAKTWCRNIIIDFYGDDEDWFGE